MDDFIEELYVKDQRDIKRGISVTQDTEGVFVYAVAQSSEFNEYLSIPATSGEPIDKQCYDGIRDMFYVSGLSYHTIGSVPVNYRMEMKNTDWSIDVPVPFSVLKRHMTEEQLRQYKEWKSEHKNCDIKFIQLVNVF